MRAHKHGRSGPRRALPRTDGRLLVWPVQGDNESEVVGATSAQDPLVSDQLRVDAIGDRELSYRPRPGVDPSEETAIVVGEEQAAIVEPLASVGILCPADCRDSPPGEHGKLHLPGHLEDHARSVRRESWSATGALGPGNRMGIGPAQAAVPQLGRFTHTGQVHDEGTVARQGIGAELARHLDRRVGRQPDVPGVGIGAPERPAGQGAEACSQQGDRYGGPSPREPDMPFTGSRRHGIAGAKGRVGERACERGGALEAIRRQLLQ